MNHFKFWADEAMNTEFGRNAAQGRLKTVIFDGGSGQTVDWLLYFGSTSNKVKLQTAANSGIDAVTLRPVSRLAVRQNATAYQVGDVVEPDGGNGWFYVCRAAGTSAESPPVWLAQAGARVADGAVVWSCVGQRLQPQHIRLALSKAGLDSAAAGAPLPLGNTLDGGTALAIHVRLTCPTDDLFEFGDAAQIGLSLNDCVEKAKD
ncbi:hypothetical protein [Conchiformibius steedae]|uniref:hypothetical protein n=1 Tax=Conchiformibius steedae TaxID=153493 RepID=UPI0026ED3C6B|nr:hypothetical protein [Conchiformibius steedae]